MSIFSYEFWYLIFQIISIIIIGIAGYSKAVMDTVQFHFNKSVFKNKDKYNQKFWNPKLSWKNKYKPDLKTPKFLFSTTLLVFWTDAWHRYQFYNITLSFISLLLIGFFSVSFINLIIFGCIARIVYGISFTYFYYKYSNKKLKI